MLVAGAALLIQTFLRLRDVDVGFRSDHLLTLDLSLPETQYADSMRVVAFYDALLERLRALPGVTVAGASSVLPLTGREGNWDIEVEGRPTKQGDPAPSPGINVATPGYYKAMRIPIIRGRVLAESDDGRGLPVAVINETMARSLWRGEDAVGRRFRILGDSTSIWVTVIGVTQDVRSWGITKAVRAEYTLAHKQMPLIVGTARRGMSVVVRTSDDPLGIANAVQREIRALDPELAVANLRTMDRVVSDSLSRPRFTMLLLVLFGATALTLAAVGVYGVMAHGVAQRSREIGIRLALGAEPRRVRGLFVLEGLALAVAGLASGVLLALLGGKLLASQLYGITPTDPPTYFGISLLLFGVAPSPPGNPLGARPSWIRSAPFAPSSGSGLFSGWRVYIQHTRSRPSMTTPSSIADIRREYARARLDEADVSHDPFVEFARWFAEAQEAQIKDPNAMTLATATADGEPSARIVLLKGVDERGFVFFTDYRSRKGERARGQSQGGARVLLGRARPAGPDHGRREPGHPRGVGALFKTRPLGSRLGAWASHQSQVIAGEGALEADLREVEQRFVGGGRSGPPHWGGYRVVPDAIEFWQGRESRLHDRIRYVREAGGKGWKVERLAMNEPILHRFSRVAWPRAGIEFGSPAIESQRTPSQHRRVRRHDLGWRDTEPYGNDAIRTNSRIWLGRACWCSAFSAPRPPVAPPASAS